MKSSRSTTPRQYTSDLANTAVKAPPPEEPAFGDRNANMAYNAYADPWLQLAVEEDVPDLRFPCGGGASNSAPSMLISLIATMPSFWWRYAMPRAMLAPSI
ncbi:hypothetical protein E2562_035570 [Oryza meyeriana var. granulata]|uniref:Uncharacterized protein n=1 Tax=Oryza meyeriana var. granulata TaxID=110450 RepID=A0A6G1ESW7_9ORYZ|nr:hypothetical protein E2562_035570 [Oryza meyeriana var. granulata]